MSLRSVELCLISEGSWGVLKSHHLPEGSLGTHHRHKSQRCTVIQASMGRDPRVGHEVLKSLKQRMFERPASFTTVFCVIFLAWAFYPLKSSMTEEPGNWLKSNLNGAQGINLSLPLIPFGQAEHWAHGKNKLQQKEPLNKVTCPTEWACWLVDRGSGPPAWSFGDKRCSV